MTALLFSMYLSAEAMFFGLNPQAQGVTGLIPGSTVGLIAPHPVPSTDKTQMYSLNTHFTWSK